MSDRDVAEQERLDIWKSETLTALTALHENPSRLDRASRKICNKLRRILSPCLFEAGPFAKVEVRFRREILDPAIELHQDLRSSSHRYDTRPITDLDKLSPKQVLHEWDLKDADTWQKPRSEREVGKALYCLHPSIVRLRTKGTFPIVIAKPVIVVTSPERESNFNIYGNTYSMPSSMTAPPAAIESSPTMDRIMSSLNQESSAQVELADSSSMSTDSDSTTASSSRRHDFNKRRASTQPIIKQEHLSRSSYRRLSVPLETFRCQQDLPGLSRSHLEGERQSSGRPRGDQKGQPYMRGHYVEGSPCTWQSQAAARQPSRRGSRDTSGDKSFPRRSVNECSQPPVSPSTVVPSTSLVKPRGLKDTFLHR